MCRCHPLLLFLLLPAAAAAEPVSFNRDIRPIMSDTCFHCHGPDASTARPSCGWISARRRSRPGKSGAVPIVPGKPEESEIIKRIFATDEDELMPPAEGAQELTAAQKETISRWVAEGAEYEPHWAYTPLARPAPPEVRMPRGRIKCDRPLHPGQLAEKQNLHLRPRRTARRCCAGFQPRSHGLPPTPEEIAAFLNDQRPEAYERQVDRLLASPHFGERMAVWWLDVVALHGHGRIPRRSESAHLSRIATTSSTRSTRTSRSINSPSSNSPAICCRIPRRSSSSPPASTG